MGKDEKKTHGMFHCDQTDVSWFQIGGTNFWSQVYGGEGDGGESVYLWKILENSKTAPLWVRAGKRRIASYIMIRCMQVGLKTREPMINGGE